MRPFRWIDNARCTTFRLIVFLSLAVMVAVILDIKAGHAIAPGITEVDETFTELSAGTKDRPIMSATTVGGVFLVATVEEFCGTASLRLLGDPDRVLTVNGIAIPSAGFELVRSEGGTLFNETTGFCSTLNPAFDPDRQLGLTSGWAAGATQLAGSKTRIAIGFTGTKNQVLLYMVLEVDAATKNVSITKPLTETFLPVDSLSLASDGTWIASFFPVGAPPGGPYRELRLFNVLDGTFRNTGLVKDIPTSCPGRLSIMSDFTLSALGQTVRIANGIVAFESDEIPEVPVVDIPGPPPAGPLHCDAIPGRAYNHDNDFVDRFIRWFDANAWYPSIDPSPTVHLGPMVHDRTPGFGGFVQDIPRGVGLLGTDGTSIAYVVLESGPFAFFPPCPDLTGDCDQGDNVLQIYDIASDTDGDPNIASGTITNTGAVVSEGLLIPAPRNADISNGVVAFLTLESSQGIPPNPPLSFGGFRDFNGDGDTNDIILRLFDIANKRVINTNITIQDFDPSGPSSGAFAIGTDGVMAGFIRPIIFGIPAPPGTSTAPGSIHYIKFGGAPPPPTDTTAPVITITSPTQGANFILNSTLTILFSASDPEPSSGLSSVSGTLNGAPVTNGSMVVLATPGTNTLSVTATDNAGNSSTQTITFTVTYQFIGFLPPLGSGPFSGVFKLNRTIPIKWQLTDANGAFIGTAVGSTTLWIASVPCIGEGDATAPFDPGTSGSTGLRYDSSSNQYIFNWQTTGLAAGCYNILMNPGDGVTRTTRNQLTP